MRRKVNKEWAPIFKTWKELSNKYCDALTKVDTIEFWENSEDDKPADMLVVCKLLEHQPDVDAVLAKITAMCRVCTVFLIEPDWRDLESWKTIIGKHLRVGEAILLNSGIISIIGFRLLTTDLPGVTIVAAGTDQDRWDNIVKNHKLIKDRLEKVPEHGGRAMIIGYGPSLMDEGNFSRIKDEMKDPGTVVVSVSGSHDYLLSRGIVPQFHSECDPRPHKADNIKEPHKDVSYFLGAVVSPVLTEKLIQPGIDVSLWFTSSEHNMLVKDVLAPDAWFVGSMGNVGLCTIALFYELGYRKFSLYGFDCSFSDDGEHQWAGPHAQKKNYKPHRLMEATCLGKVYKTTPVMLSYVNNFIDVIRLLPNCEFNVYGEGLLQAWCRAYGLKIKEAA